MIGMFRFDIILLLLLHCSKGIPQEPQGNFKGYPIPRRRITQDAYQSPTPPPTFRSDEINNRGQDAFEPSDNQWPNPNNYNQESYNYARSNRTGSSSNNGYTRAPSLRNTPLTRRQSRYQPTSRNYATQQPRRRTSRIFHFETTTSVYQMNPTTSPCYEPPLRSSERNTPLFYWAPSDTNSRAHSDQASNQYEVSLYVHNEVQVI